MDPSTSKSPPNARIQRTILLMSRDAGLHEEISRLLGAGERIVRIGPGLSAGLIRAGPARVALVALDCRTISRDDVRDTLVAFRSEIRGLHVHCVYIVCAGSDVMSIVGRGGAGELDVLLAESEHVGQLLRALLNDPTRSAGTALAFAAIARAFHGREMTLRVAGAVLATGCRVHKVGQIETKFGMSRERIGEILASEGSPQPKYVVQLARALYAIVLLRRTPLSAGKVAAHIRYIAGRWLKSLFISAFGIAPAEATTWQANRSDDELLDALVAKWAARHGVAK